MKKKKFTILIALTIIITTVICDNKSAEAYEHVMNSATDESASETSEQDDYTETDEMSDGDSDSLQYGDDYIEEYSDEAVSEDYNQNMDEDENTQLEDEEYSDESYDTEYTYEDELENPEYWREQDNGDDPSQGRFRKKRVIIPQDIADTDKYIHDERFDEAYITKGVDISKYQPNTDWEKAKAAGVDFAFVRVAYRGYGGSGSLNEDCDYKDNLINAAAAGVKTGVYIYSQAISVEEAIEEADYIVDRIADYEVTLPVVMDYEYYSDENGVSGRLSDAHLNREETTQVVTAFCDRVAQRGYTAGIYADYGMITSRFDTEQIDDEYKLWIARWNNRTDYSGNYSFWQFSDSGKVDGIRGYVDLDFAYELLDIPERMDDYISPEDRLIGKSGGLDEDIEVTLGVNSSQKFKDVITIVPVPTLSAPTGWDGLNTVIEAISGFLTGYGRF